MLHLQGISPAVSDSTSLPVPNRPTLVNAIVMNIAKAA
jgi:hypothetical protein